MSENLYLCLSFGLARMLNGVVGGTKNYLLSEKEFDGDLSIDFLLVLRLLSVCSVGGFNSVLEEVCETSQTVITVIYYAI